MRFKVARWMTKPSEINTKLNKGDPMPMVVMFGKVLKETEKSIFVELHGKPEPTDSCLHCGRKLTNKVSMFYGLGPKCGGHYYITNVTEANLQENFEDIRRKMAEIKWRGWIPKKSVTITLEKFHTITFLFRSKQYRITTADETKIKEVYEKADSILSDIVTEG